MKALLFKFGLLAACVVSNSWAAEPTKHPAAPENVSQQDNPSRLESISYDWDKYGVRVSFYRQNSDSDWTMQVKDAWSIYDQLAKDERVWTPSNCRCSLDEGLHIIGQSLSRFYADRPNAKLRIMDLEMEVIRDIWTETLTGINEKLVYLKTKKSAARADVPDEIDVALQSEAKMSPGLKKIGALLTKHGFSVRDIHPSSVTFKDSLTGYTWSSICKSPGAGVLVPGIFEFVSEARVEIHKQ